MSRYAIRAALIIGVLLGATLVQPRVSNAYEVGLRSGFPVTLSGARVRFGSPTLADLNNDGKLEIIVGGDDGVVYAVSASGALLWSYNASNAVNATASATPNMKQSTKPIPIRTAPAVGDVTGDSSPEIAVGLGDVFQAETHGGVVLLNASGKLVSGWPQVTLDVGGTGALNEIPDNLTDGVLSSPAIGDIDGDGTNEVVYGAFDQRIYARRANGTLLPGWPQFVLDTVWSSPALADLDGDGVAEVIVGVDTHTYNSPPRHTVQGGDLYAFKGDGSILWRANQDEIFQSSPAVGDIDNDGLPEVVAGTGTFYSGPPFNLPVGRYVSAWNHDGSLRWRTSLPERVFGSPALGDVNGDGTLDAVVGALDGKAYAFNGTNGSILWSTLGRDIFNNQFLSNPQLFSPVLADVDGDGLDDAFFGLGWDVIVFKGTNGALLTGTTPGDTKPSYYGSYSVLGTPAIGDLDGDGKLDLVAASGTTSEPGKARVFSWRLANSSLKASWPQFHRDARHSGVLPQIMAASAITALLETGASSDYTLTFRRSDGAGLSWSVSESDPDSVISLDRTSGSSNDELTVTLKAPASKGTYTGSLTVSGGGLPPVTVSITLVAADQVFKVFAPIAKRS